MGLYAEANTSDFILMKLYFQTLVISFRVLGGTFSKIYNLNINRRGFTRKCLQAYGTIICPHSHCFTNLAVLLLIFNSAACRMPSTHPGRLHTQINLHPVPPRSRLAARRPCTPPQTWTSSAWTSRPRQTHPPRSRPRRKTQRKTQTSTISNSWVVLSKQ